MRYTEARLTAVARNCWPISYLDTVDFQPNYHERPGKDEPTVLPGKFPNLLVNGSTGIAVGMACNLLPHNLGEISDAIVTVLDVPQTSLSELMKIVPGPDFPTGGIIMGTDGIVEGYSSGRGRCTLRARHHVEEHKGRVSVVLDDLPYGTVRKAVTIAVSEAVKAGRMDDVSAVNDESGRKHDCRIVVDLKRGAEPEVVINQLWQYTPAQVTVSMINIAIVGRRPRTLGLRNSSTTSSPTASRSSLGGRGSCSERPSKRPTCWRARSTPSSTSTKSCRSFARARPVTRPSKSCASVASRIQADHRYAAADPAGPYRAGQHRRRGTAVTRSGRGHRPPASWSSSSASRSRSSPRSTAKSSKRLTTTSESILGDDNAVRDIIREDTIEMKEKYANPRRTYIDPTAYNAASKEMLITPEDVVVTLTHAGYIKRLPLDAYRARAGAAGA